MSAPHFIGPAWNTDGTPLLVAALDGRGYARQADRRRTRPVVDDYGNAVMYARRCPSCLRWLPLSFDHFSPSARSAGLGMERRCNVCVTLEDRLRRRARPEVLEHRNRSRRQRYARDPDLVERSREHRRRWIERQLSDPERARRYKERKKRSQERYRARLLADPARHAAALERDRIARALRGERQGRPLDERRHHRTKYPVENARVLLPSAPLAVTVDAALARSDDPTAEFERLGVSERLAYGWRTGERPRVELGVAGRVLVALGLLWHDVWTPDTVRRPLLIARLARPFRKTLADGRRVTYWDYGARGYGDAGPDHEALAAVERAWEGDREASAA